jgi:hypothetical protein
MGGSIAAFELSLAVAALVVACSPAGPTNRPPDIATPIVAPSPDPPCRDGLVRITLENLNANCVSPPFNNYIRCMQGVNLAFVKKGLEGQEAFKAGGKASLSPQTMSAGVEVSVEDQKKAQLALETHYTQDASNVASVQRAKDCGEAFHKELDVYLASASQQRIEVLSPPTGTGK